MTYQQRFEYGYKTAFNSFTMVWQHKKLILYGMIAFTRLFLLIGGAAIARDSMIRLLLFICGVWLHLLVGIFFEACIVKYSASILTRREESFWTVVRDCFAKKRVLCVWGTLSIISLVTWVGGIWTFAMFFVLPIIVLEAVDVWTAMKRSIHMVKNWLFEMLGGFFGMALLMIVPVIFFVVCYISAQSVWNKLGQEMSVISGMLIFVLGICLVTIGGFLNAAMNVLATKMYHQYYKGKEDAFTAYERIEM